MNFCTALVEMQGGGRNRRLAWPADSVSVYLDETEEPPTFKAESSSGYVSRWVPTQEDVLAEDWRSV